MNSFHKEYSFEIKVIILFTLGIFLLVEDLEIKNYIYEFIRTVLFTIGNGINFIKDFSEGNNYVPFISVVIASRNDAHNLPTLLNLLIQQTYPQNSFEIIIVNDRSSDDSDKILAASDNFFQSFCKT